MVGYIVVDNDEAAKFSTDFDYAVGEVITLNSVDKIKCKGIRVIDGMPHYFFFRGRLVFD